MAKHYTINELNEIKYLYLNERLSVDEIAEKTGRTRTAIMTIVSEMKLHRSRLTKRELEKRVAKEPEKKAASLDDFTLREIIKYAYKEYGVRINDEGKLVCIINRPVEDDEMKALGYFVQNGKLYHIEEREINVKDVIEN